MRTFTTTVSPQTKIIQTNRRLGNNGIQNQQGTSRILYDTLPIDGRNLFEFFKNSQARQIPFSNTGSYGNKLEIGETMIIARYYLALITFDAVNTETIDTVVPIASVPAVTGGDLLIILANNVVVKPIPVLSSVSSFNKSASFGDNLTPVGQSVFEFDTQIVIPPLLDFVFALQYAQLAAIPDTFIRLTIEGIGSIIAPQTTF